MVSLRRHKQEATATPVKKPGILKRLKGKVTSAFRKAVIGTVLVAPFAGVGFYGYGTEQSVDAKILEVKTTPHTVYMGPGLNTTSYTDYIIVTDHGTFVDNASMLRMKDGDDKIAGGMKAGEIYEFRSYGMDLTIPFTDIGFQHNLLGANKLTAEEAQARANERARAEAERQAQLNATPSPAPSTDPVVVPPVVTDPGAEDPSCPTGTNAVINTVVNNEYVVQVVMPCETRGRVTITSVKPLNP